MGTGDNDALQPNIDDVMTAESKTHIVKKEDAVFRLDANGRWHNRHGPFSHKRVIDYFHACIKKDRAGFYLSQERDGILEKVYFPYEETALFVFDVIPGEEIVLVLNTRERLELDPHRLLIKADSLYMRRDDDLVKFTDRSMIKMAEFIEGTGQDYRLVYRGRQYPIASIPDVSL